ncbi:ran GTPase-activating protein 1-like isoform X3 [Babylonia areolata]
MANKADLTLLDLNANQLGEGGIELVQDTMEALGKVELLASFSDDEGSDDEDEEDECDQEDEEEPREDNEGEVNEDPQLQVTGTAITPAKQTITGKEFLAFPSPGKLQQLGPDCVQSMKEAIGADADDPSKVVETVVRVSLVVEENNEKSQKCACEIADGLLQHVFSQMEGADTLVTNAFLVCLGLIKGEDKKYKAPSDISGPLLVLNHIIQQTYFPRSARETLSFFLSRPHAQLEKAAASQHKILQTLYAF